MKEYIYIWYLTFILISKREFFQYYWFYLSIYYILHLHFKKKSTENKMIIWKLLPENKIRYNGIKLYILPRNTECITEYIAFLGQHFRLSSTCAFPTIALVESCLVLCTEYSTKMTTSGVWLESVVTFLTCK